MPEQRRPSRYPDPAVSPNQVPGAFFGYGYSMPVEHPAGTLVLILGIVGLVFPLTAPVAWVMGSSARKEMRRNGRRYSNESSLLIGEVLGILVSIGWLLGLMAFLGSLTFGWALFFR